MFSHESTDNLLDNLECELTEIIELEAPKSKNPIKVEEKKNYSKFQSPPPVAARRNPQNSPVTPLHHQPVPARRHHSIDKNEKNDENEIIQLQSLTSDHESITSESQQVESKHSTTVIHVNEKPNKRPNKKKPMSNIRVVHEADKMPDDVNETFFVIKHGKWADQKDDDDDDDYYSVDKKKKEEDEKGEKEESLPKNVDEEIKVVKEDTQNTLTEAKSNNNNKSKVTKKKKVLKKKHESSQSSSASTAKSEATSSTESSSSEDIPQPIKKKTKRSSKARKKDKKSKRDDNTIDTCTEDESVSKKCDELEKSSSVDNFIGIYINNTGPIKYRTTLKSPRLKISFYNEDNGKQIGESMWSKTGKFNNEFYNLICTWSEMITATHDIKHLREIYNNVLIFFEMINDEDVAICWAFLKLFSPESLNFNNKFRLQFWEYQTVSKSCFALMFKRKNLKSSDEISIFEQWQMERKMFPSVLNIFVKNLTGKDDANAKNYKIPKIVNVSSENIQRHWRKIPGQACKIPNKMFSKILLPDKGSMVVKFSHDGNFLAYSEISKNGHCLNVYRFPEMTCVFTLLEHSEIIHDIDWLKQKTYTKQRIVTASADFTAIVWQFEGSAYTYTILPHPAFVYASKFLQNDSNSSMEYISSNNLAIVTGGRDNIVRIWKNSNGSEIFDLAQELKHPQKNQFTFITSIVTRNAETFYTSTSTGEIAEWTLQNSGDYHLNRNFSLNESHVRMINCMEINPRGNKICFRVQSLSNFDVANMIYVLGIPTGSITQKYQQINVQRVNNQGNLKITPCGSQLLISNGSIIRHYQLINGNLATNEDEMNFVNVKFALGEKGYITSMDYHPKDFYLACATYGGIHSSIVVCSYESNEIDPIEQMKIGSQERILQKSLELQQVGAFSNIIRRLDEVFLAPATNINSIKLDENPVGARNNVEDNTITIDSKRSGTYTVSKGPATFTIQKGTYEIQKNDDTDEDDTTISESFN